MEDGNILWQKHGYSIIDYGCAYTLETDDKRLNSSPTRVAVTAVEVRQILESDQRAYDIIQHIMQEHRTTSAPVC